MNQLCRYFHISVHASCRELPRGVLSILESCCCPERDSSMSPSLSLLSCFCGDIGLEPFEFKLELNVDARWDIHSLAELPELQVVSHQSIFDSSRK